VAPTLLVHREQNKNDRKFEKLIDMFSFYVFVVQMMRNGQQRVWCSLIPQKLTDRLTSSFVIVFHQLTKLH